MNGEWIDKLKEDTEKYDRDCDKMTDDYDKEVKENGKRWDESIK